MVRKAWLLLLVSLLLIGVGCGSSDSSGSSASTVAAPTQGSATLVARLDFGTSASRVLARLPDTATNYQLQVFTLNGQLLASQSGSRVPGSGAVTVTITGLPAGQAVVRLTLSDASGNPLGVDDQSVLLAAGGSASLTFETVTGGAPAASPSPSVAASPLPSPAASVVPSPAASPVSSPSPSPAPAASPVPVSLSVGPANLAVQVGNSATVQVLETFSDGRQRDVTAQASLSLSAPGIFSLQGAQLSALQAGQVVLTAQLGTLQGSLSVVGFVPPQPFMPVPPPVIPSPSPPTPAPAVTGIAPTLGLTSGGASVTLTGTNLAGATAVLFGGVPGTITGNTGTTVSVTSPARGVGTVDVQVTTAGGTSPASPADQYQVIGTILGTPLGATESGSQVTLTTADPSGLVVGSPFTIAGVQVAGYNGPQTATGATGNQLTYITGAGLSGSGGATVTLLDSFVTSSTAVAAGSVVVTPSTMSPGIVVGARLAIDVDLASFETVTVTGTTATTFTATFGQAHAPGFTIQPPAATAIANSSSSSSTGSDSTVTVTTSAVHGLSSGELAFVSGTSPRYNGAFVVTSVTSPTVFSYNILGPAQPTSIGGVVYGVSTVAAAPLGATESGTTVTLTTTNLHGLSGGQQVLVSGVGVAGYNGVFPVGTVLSPTQFTYTASPGLGASGGASLTSP